MLPLCRHAPPARCAAAAGLCGEIDGRPRTLLAMAARNGYYFLLDRTNGKNIVTAPYAKPNWPPRSNTITRSIGQPFN